MERKVRGNLRKRGRLHANSRQPRKSKHTASHSHLHVLVHHEDLHEMYALSPPPSAGTPLEANPPGNLTTANRNRERATSQFTPFLYQQKRNTCAPLPPHHTPLPKQTSQSTSHPSFNSRHPHHHPPKPLQTNPQLSATKGSVWYHNKAPPTKARNLRSPHNGFSEKRKLWKLGQSGKWEMVQAW